MKTKAWSNYLRGEVSCRYEGPFPERALNLCASHGILFWGVEHPGATTLRFHVSRQDARRLQQLGEELEGKLTCGRGRGVPFLWGRMKSRTALWAAGIVSLMLLGVSSLFIWEVQVEGNETISTEQVLQALEQEGVGFGTFAYSFNQTELRNRMMLRLPQLSYLAVNVQGCIAHVQVRERVNPPEMIASRQPSNLVARRDGLVTTVEALDGVAAVLPGTTVQQGQLLISGVAPSARSGVRLLHGMGRVTARTWYDLAVLLPLTAQKKCYTGEVQHRHTLILGQKRIKLYENSSITPVNCDKLFSTHRLTLLGLALPFVWETETLRRYTVEEVSVEEDALQRQGEAQLSALLQQQIHGTVTTTRFAALRRGDCLLVTLTAECLEEIGQLVPIVT